MKPGSDAPPGTTNSGKRTTIYDIAHSVGTSPSAVSAVLNGTWRKRRISQKLADRISTVAIEQGYSVNLQASVLRRDRSNIIGMVIPKYDNRYFGAIAEQFEEGARQRGYFPVITCTQRDPELEFEAARMLLSYQVECLVVTGATDPDRISDLCHAAGVKVINLDLPGTKAPSVISDNFQGALDLTRLLLRDQGHEAGRSERIYFVGGRTNDHNTSERIRGFLQAHAEKGLKVPQTNILACGYAAQKAHTSLAALECLPEGIFVNSTISLEGVVMWLSELPPERQQQIQYCCFDWDPFAALMPNCVGMAQQDVPALLDYVFKLISTDLDSTEIKQIACNLRGQKPSQHAGFVS